MGREEKYHWEMLKTKYITDETHPSLVKFSQENNLEYVTVKLKAAKEKWNVLRDEYWLKASKIIEEECLKKATQFRMRNLKVVDDAIMELYRRLKGGELKANMQDIERLVVLQHKLLFELFRKSDDTNTDAQINITPAAISVSTPEQLHKILEESLRKTQEYQAVLDGKEEAQEVKAIEESAK